MAHYSTKGQDYLPSNVSKDSPDLMNTVVQKFDNRHKTAYKFLLILTCSVLKPLNFVHSVCHNLKKNRETGLFEPVFTPPTTSRSTFDPITNEEIRHPLDVWVPDGWVTIQVTASGHRFSDGVPDRILHFIKIITGNRLDSVLRIIVHTGINSTRDGAFVSREHRRLVDFAGLYRQEFDHFFSSVHELFPQAVVLYMGTSSLRIQHDRDRSLWARDVNRIQWRAIRNAIQRLPLFYGNLMNQISDDDLEVTENGLEFGHVLTERLPFYARQLHQMLLPFLGY